VSESKEHSWNSYYLVFNALILLTVITVGLSYIDVGELLSAGSEFGHNAAAGIPGIGHFLAKVMPVVEIGHGANIVLGMIVAILKASLVLWFFMHQDHEEGINRFIVAFSIGLLLLAFVVFNTDFVFLGTYAHELAGAALGMN
jgi:caa(3)-type oxidase subunit IV